MTNERALTGYIARVAQANKLLDTIKTYLDNHGEVPPDDVNWTDTADMGNIVSILENIVEFINKSD